MDLFQRRCVGSFFVGAHRMFAPRRMDSTCSLPRPPPLQSWTTPTPALYAELALKLHVQVDHTLHA